MFSYILHPKAQKEYLSSTNWYLKRSLIAAENFVAIINKGFINICTNPTQHPVKFDIYHEYQTEHYPFTIIYYLDKPKELIVISAIYHQKRNPANKYRQLS